MTQVQRLALFHGIDPSGPLRVYADAHRIWRLAGEGLTGGHAYAEIGVVHRAGAGSDPDSAVTACLAQLAEEQQAKAARFRQLEAAASRWGQAARAWGAAAEAAEGWAAFLVGETT